MRAAERRALERAYRRTRYEVDHPLGGFTIRIGRICPPLDALLHAHGLGRWAYLTACNPRSRSLGEADNARRQRRLRDLLRRKNRCHLFGHGVPARPGWTPEPSVLVLGIAPPAARELARRFQQNAIVIGRQGQPARLLWCRRRIS